LGACATEFHTDPVYTERLPGPTLRIEICLPIAHQGRVRPESAWETFLAEIVVQAFPGGFSVIPAIHLLPLGNGRILRLDVQILIAHAEESVETREALSHLLAAWRAISGSGPVSVGVQPVRTFV